MIVVKIELWPKGIEEHKREIGRMTITNDATTTTLKRGHYDIAVMRRGTKDKVQRIARVENYPRESYTIWELVKRALNNVYGKSE